MIAEASLVLAAGAAIMAAGSAEQSAQGRQRLGKCLLGGSIALLIAAATGVGMVLGGPA